MVIFTVLYYLSPCFRRLAIGGKEDAGFIYNKLDFSTFGPTQMQPLDKAKGGGI
ncbi:unnamed protein product [Absidia cylindrospora]